VQDQIADSQRDTRGRDNSLSGISDIRGGLIRKFPSARVFLRLPPFFRFSRDRVGTRPITNLVPSTYICMQR